MGLGGRGGSWTRGKWMWGGLSALKCGNVQCVVVMMNCTLQIHPKSSHGRIRTDPITQYCLPRNRTGPERTTEAGGR